MATSSFRALVVSAHPDDIEFGLAGTVAKWTDAGADVTYCISTDGSTGTQDRELMGEPLARIRKEETEEAARIAGVEQIVWLGLRDGYVEYSLDLRREIARVFRQCKPHRFVVMDPTPVIGEFVNHPDHRAVGQASLDVSMTAGTTPGHFPELLEEGLEPWRGLRELWIMGPGLRQHVVDISDTIDRKIKALMAHVSQVGDNADAIAEFVRTHSAEAGATAGFDYAESFDVISQGPGFHAGEQDDTDADLAKAPLNPPSAPVRKAPPP